MSDTLKRLVGPTSLGTSAVTLYTVPASTKTVVRNIHVCNETTGAVGFTLSIGPDNAGSRWFKDLEVPANGAFDWSGSLVLNAAEVVQAKASVGSSSLTLSLSGIESA